MSGPLLAGKVGIVTGAGSGIGRATALAAARAGSRVVVAEIREEPGRETVGLIEAAGGEAHFVQCDVRKAEAVSAMVAATVGRFGGRLDWACNNAALGQLGPFLEVSDADWDRTIAGSLTSTFLCMRAELAAMLEAGGERGSIINISSVTGVTGTALEAAYAAAKGGVEAMSKSVAGEFGVRGIRVNTIAPGTINTPGIEHAMRAAPELREQVEDLCSMRRLGKPEEIADAVVWLASDGCGYLTGHTLVIDGGIGPNSVLLKS